MNLVYDDLRRLAGRYMRWERRDHTLQPTALVHETFLRLALARGVQLTDRTHFFALGARIMRHILVDHARRRKPKDQLESVGQADLKNALNRSWKDPSELLSIDKALSRLGERYSRAAAVVEMRFFGGLSEAEIAEELNVTIRTVKRDWRFARAWLFTELTKAAGSKAR